MTSCNGAAALRATAPPPLMSRPYQPSLLRLLHGGVALLSLLAWISGLGVFLSLDQRWGPALTLPLADWIDLHGSLAVVLWPVALLFTLYALTAGRARLVQPANAIPLLALLLAIGSGLSMDEDWLRQGQLDHLVYKVHLSAWMLLALMVVLHLGALLRRGGWPLAHSMASLRVKAGDRPGQWPSQILRALQSGSR